MSLGNRLTDESEEYSTFENNHKTHIVLLCNECYSDDLKRYEGKMTENGHDWFTCKDCNHNFPLRKASYSSGM